MNNSANQRWKGRIRACGWLLLALLLIAGPFNRAGLWEPFELRFAELSRRLAHQLFDAKVTFSASETLKAVTQGQLTQGELPFTSSAFGFALFGPHDFAGRIVSLAWGFVAAVSLWILLGRFSRRPTQVVGVFVLVSLPSFVWQSRMILGDAATMGSLALATTGLVLACLDTGPLRARIGWALLGLVGLVAGQLCRGILLGVFVPVTAVGLAGLRFAFQSAGSRTVRAKVAAFPGTCLVVGLGALGFGLASLLQAARGYSWLLGAVLQGPYPGGSFAAVVSALFHAAFPWSAFFPVAMALAAVAPQLQEEARLRNQAVSTSLLLTVALTVSAMGAMSTRLVTMPFPAVAALAGLTGIALVRGHQEKRAARLIAISVAAIALVIYADFENLPEKLLLSTGIATARLPEGFFIENRRWLRISLAVLLLSCVIVTVGQRIPGSRPFSRERIGWLVQKAKALFVGHFGSGLVLLETMLVTTALLVHAHERGFIFVPVFESTLPNFGLFLKLLCLVPPLVVGVIPLVVALLMEGAGWLFSCYPSCPTADEQENRQGYAVGVRGYVAFFFRPTPMTVLGTGLLLSGLCVTLGQIPKFSEQLSAKSALRRYQEVAKPGEPLALLGMGAKSAAYYLSSAPTSHADVGAAAHWLAQAQSSRRFLVFGQEELAELNSAFRAETGGRNLVLNDPNEGYVLLAYNPTAEGEPNYNPLAAALPAVPPQLRHPLVGAFGDSVETLGWEFRDSRGRLVDALEVGKAYRLKLAFRVVDTLPVDWQLFVHLDGTGRRQNGDHDPVNGKYPTDLWQAGDIVLDDYLMKLEPGFGPGSYRLYFGFFRNTRRLDVTRGNHDDNRLFAGDVVIR